MATAVGENLATSRRRYRAQLQPLMPRYKVILNPALDQLHRQRSGSRCPGDVMTNKVRDVFTSRVCSLKVEPTDGMADIDYLREKLGFCMPTEEQVLHEESLKTTRRGSHRVTRSQVMDIISAMSIKSEKSVSTENDQSEDYADDMESLRDRIEFHLQHKAYLHKKVDHKRIQVERKLAYIQQNRAKITLSTDPLNTKKPGKTTLFLSQLARQALMDNKRKKVRDLRNRFLWKSREIIEQQDRLLMQRVSVTIEADKLKELKEHQHAFRRKDRAYQLSIIPESIISSERDSSTSLT